ncbi:MAG: NADH:flavin oxidoreductase [Shewanella psychromarinicola]|jgi:2,4-dienoyl-CoA reductase-like NADH-dependent reductase (Old Yellow Enzyme family)|uniref:NADH:flavin oxidoreductase n=1 Tax=Shewanella TaxID=22 RepID=UPI000C333B03|nr:NADH:flavin oxidoreductase [Shewanella sp. Actino-trap-3]PKG77447.1 oxidoreductase [Shewanella sp. Actino-trap-3]
MSIDRRTLIKFMGIAAASASTTVAFGSNASSAAPVSTRKLFEEVKLGTLTLKNRLIRSATSQYRATVDGDPTEDLMRVHRELAQGGVSLIITGLTYIMKDDQYGQAGTGLYDDSQIDLYQKVVKNAHDHGAKIAVQLAMVGPQSDYRIDHRVVYGASKVPHPIYGTVPNKVMTKDDIKFAIQSFIDAALRAKKAGFDAIELHFAHNYLVSQFLFPYYNDRTDEYGGPIENRARFAFEILEAVRGAVGADYPIIAKVHGRDYLGSQAGGNTQDENLFVIKGLVKRGITALDISGGNKVRGMGEFHPELQDEKDQSYFADDAKYISEHVDVPMMVTGGNRSPHLMEKILAEVSNIEAFGFGRTMLSEPNLANNWKQDPNHKPRCLSCNWCIANYGTQKSQCVLNVSRAYIPAGH